MTLDYPAPAGAAVRALERVSLSVQSGEFVSLVGPSGCGKSTILKLVAGLLAPTSGNVLLAGRAVDGVPAGFGFMFQQDALLPWATAIENVAAVLGRCQVARSPRASRPPLRPGRAATTPTPTAPAPPPASPPGASATAAHDHPRSPIDLPPDHLDRKAYPKVTLTYWYWG